MSLPIHPSIWSQFELNLCAVAFVAVPSFKISKRLYGTLSPLPSYTHVFIPAIPSPPLLPLPIQPSFFIQQLRLSAPCNPVPNPASQQAFGPPHLHRVKLCRQAKIPSSSSHFALIVRPHRHFSLLDPSVYHSTLSTRVVLISQFLSSHLVDWFNCCSYSTLKCDDVLVFQL